MSTSLIEDIGPMKDTTKTRLPVQNSTLIDDLIERLTELKNQGHEDIHVMTCPSEIPEEDEENDQVGTWNISELDEDGNLYIRKAQWVPHPLGDKELVAEHEANVRAKRQKLNEKK